MKFITNFTKTILIISLISASMCLNLLRRKSKTKDPLNLTLPADYQGTTKATKDDAKAQVAAARKLLTTPGDKATLILKTAATILKTNWETSHMEKNEEVDSNFNRSINGGVWNEKATGKAHEDIAMQRARFARVASGVGEPRDRAGVLAVLGDIGTAVFDCNDLPGELAKVGADRKENKIKELQAYCFIADAFAKVFGFRTKEPFIAQGKEAKAARGGSAIAPKKKAERDMISEGGKLKLVARSGLLAQGNEPTNNGFSAKWPWQRIPENYLSRCPEPWAGHYSGSIVEILFMLDTFTRKNAIIDPFEDDAHSVILPLKSFRQGAINLDSPYRKCKAALAAAFLISIGYHSAIEVKPTIWMYLKKQNQPTIFTNDSTKDDCDVKATRDIVKLMEDCTAK